MSEELKLIDVTASDFAAKELVEGREENDRYPFAPLCEGLLAKAQEVGFFAVMLPEELGGSAEAVQALCLVLQDVCKEDASLGGVIFTAALALELIAQAGGREILKEVAAAASPGEAIVAFPSFNNPGEILPDLRADGKDGGYELAGRADYVVLGGVASRALLPARAGDGYSLFLLDLKGEGVSAGDPVLSLGLHACPAVDLELGGAAGTLVGAEGRGGAYFEAAVDRLSVAAAAMAAGVIKGSFEAAFAYAKERVQGGREIVNWSEVRMILSSMAVAGKVAEMLVEQAGRAVDAAEPGWQLASRAAALQVQEIAAEVTCDGIQLLGGNGYMKDYGQEKRFRDAKQIQALLGLAPMRRLKYIRRVADGEPPW